MSSVTSEHLMDVIDVIDDGQVLRLTNLETNRI